jgi:hypothetical protein
VIDDSEVAVKSWGPCKGPLQFSKTCNIILRGVIMTPARLCCQMHVRLGLLHHSIEVSVLERLSHVPRPHAL